MYIGTLVLDKEMIGQDGGGEGCIIQRVFTQTSIQRL